MKSAPNWSKGNLRPPNPKRLEEMRQIIDSAASPPLEKGGLYWDDEEGFKFYIPSGAHQDKPISHPLYLISLCFLRLTTDPNFRTELLNWARRNQN